MYRKRNVIGFIFTITLLLGLWKLVDNLSVMPDLDSKPDIPPDLRLEKYQNEIFDEFSYSDLTTQAKELFTSEHLHLIEEMGGVTLQADDGITPNLWFLLVKNVKAKDAAKNIIDELKKLGEKAFIQKEYDSGSYFIYVGPILDFQLAEKKKSMVDDSLGVESRLYRYAREFPL